MPRDKSQTHVRVIEAAKKEFVEKGFEAASIREIGRMAGITSAGLYRHCKDKDDLFRQVVEPATGFMETEIRIHKEESMNAVINNPKEENIYDTNEVDILLELLKEYPVEARLLFCCAKGTSYETYVHKLIEAQEEQMMLVLEYMKAHGLKALNVNKKEMHVMITAYITALLEPFEHNYSYEEAKHCYKSLIEFFQPGWKKIMGF